MPVRNQMFIFDADEEIDTDKAAVYGIHQKKGWKSWGNKN
jgi:hypothetical protein